MTLYDERGNKLDLTEEEKKKWFEDKGAKVDDLTADEVRQIAAELVWLEDEIEEVTEEQQP